jgi:hypothetical protein
MRNSAKDKNQLILEIARSFGIERFTLNDLAEIQIRLMAQLGEPGRAETDEIAKVLQDAGMRMAKSSHEALPDQYEEEFEDLLHFSTLDEAEMTLVRIDDLWRKFIGHDEREAAERVLEVARLGKRRAEMIARNPKVNPKKRAEKEEIVQWFRIWLETPDAFFDWVEMRKQSPEFQEKFGGRREEL